MSKTNKSEGREPTHTHHSPIPGIQVEVHDSMEGFWFRLRVEDKVSPWTGYRFFATVEHKGATYLTHSAYWEGTFGMKEMEVGKVTKLVNLPGVVVDG